MIADCQICRNDQVFLFCISDECRQKRRCCFNCQQKHSQHINNLLNLNLKADFVPFRNNLSPNQANSLQRQIQTSQQVIARIRQKALQSLRILIEQFEKEIRIAQDFFTYIYESSDGNYFMREVRSRHIDNGEKLDNIAKFMKIFPQSSFKDLKGARIFFNNIEVQFENFARYLSEKTKQFGQDMKQKIHKILTNKPNEEISQMIAQTDQIEITARLYPYNEEISVIVPKEANINEVLKKLQEKEKIPVGLKFEDIYLMNESQYGRLEVITLQTKVQNIAIGRRKIALIIPKKLSQSTSQQIMVSITN